MRWPPAFFSGHDRSWRQPAPIGRQTNASAACPGGRRQPNARASQGTALTGEVFFHLRNLLE